MKSKEKQVQLKVPLLLSQKKLVGQQIPQDELEMVADAHAHLLWGEDIARGIAIPLVDQDGNRIAYAFPYIRGAQHFPESTKIFEEYYRLNEDVQSLVEIDLQKHAEALAALNRYTGQFGSIYVSTRRTMHPILRVSHFLHPYFRNSVAAQAESTRQLKSEETQLNEVVFLGPHQEYFDFSVNDQHILLNVDSLEPPNVQPEYLDHSRSSITFDTDDCDSDMWKDITSLSPSLINEYKKIQYYDCVPVIFAILPHWCQIATQTMVLGFYDNFEKGHGIGGFGRLIEYWYDHPSNGVNVPSMIDELVTPPNGPGSRMTRVARKHGYTFVDATIPGNAENDWGWTVVKGEIDAGYPVHWGIWAKDPNGEEQGHSLAVLGYRITGKDKYYILYDTWHAQEDEWNYRYWKCWGPATGLEVETFRPLAKDERGDLIIEYPDGGEVLSRGHTYPITWYIWGDYIDEVRIEFSRYGGFCPDSESTWSLIATVKTEKGRHTYDWVPEILTTKGRIRIRGYAMHRPNIPDPDWFGPAYIAGDGSFKNFQIT